MNENVKTAIFVGIAVVVVLVAWIAKPSLPEVGSVDLRDKPLFPTFEDALAATSMEIVEFDKETAKPRRFKVAQVPVAASGKMRWSIPSHDGYPADAKDHLASAAANMHGLRIIELVSEDKGDHATYGVVDPLDNDASGSDVGTRVTLKDKKDRELASLIIGKEVPGHSELRYVRKVEQGVPKDPVYTTEISVDKFSTKFSDWIEKDLLKLNTWDIKQVQIKDYSVDELQGAILHRGDMLFSYDDTGDQKWKLTKDMVLKKVGEKLEWVPEEMAEDEELDTGKLDELKNALDDLEIVDVSRKPPGLSGNLRAAKSFFEDPQAQQSLHDAGFYVVPVGSDRYELFSNEGEVRCMMKDGVVYVLRFGEIALGSRAAGKKDEKGEKGKKDDESAGLGLNRYIFVMAEFDENLIPKPELEPLPEEKEKPAAEEKAKVETPEEKDTGGQPPEGKPTDEPTAEKTDNASTDEKAADPPADEKAADQPADEKAADPPADEKVAKESTEENPGDESAEEKPSEESTERTKDEGDDAKADEKVDEKAEKKVDIEAERKRIEKENKRKEEEYQQKKEDGKKKVDELNERFADWYYIISDEVYQKIHLSRDQVVKKKEKKEEEKTGKEGKGDEAGADTGDAGPGADQPDAGTEKAEPPTDKPDLGAGDEAAPVRDNQPEGPAGPPTEPEKPEKEKPGGNE